MATSTSLTTALTDVPAVLKPYITDPGGILPTAQKLLSTTENPYSKVYGDPLKEAGLAGSGRVAGLSPFQTDVRDQLKTMTTPGQFQQGTQAVQSGIGSLGQAQNMYGNIGQVGAPSLAQYQMQAAPNTYAPNLNYYQASGPGNISNQDLQTYQMSGPQSYTGSNVSQYMSPYQQNVVDYQKSEAVRDYDKAAQGQNARAVAAGAFGGSRQAIERSEANRNLQSQLQGIQATGSQNAFQNAQQQFNAQQQAQQAANQANLQAALGVQQLGSTQNLQAQQANQAANQATNLANLQAMMGTQQFGAGQNLQSQLANQATQQGSNQANLQALLGVQQLGAGQSLEAQKANQAAQLASAQGIGQLGSMYGNLGSTMGALGTAQQASNLDLLKTKGAFGDLQRGIQQQQLDTQYQDLMSKLNYPLSNLETMNNLVRGAPLTQTGSSTSQTTPAPSFASQLAGTGLTGLSLYNMFGKP